MSIKNLEQILENELNKIYKRILAKKTVRICIYTFFIIFYPGLVLAITIAEVYGPKGYNIFNNYISDLGSIRYTPAPFILDVLLICTSLLLIPIFLYLEQILVSGPNLSKRFLNKSIFIKILARIGKISFILGSIGLLGAGIFNEDFSPFNIHLFTAILFFGGYFIGAFSTGLIILLKKVIIPKAIGYIMVFNSSGIFILYAFIKVSFITYYFIEWCLFLSILIWFIPITIIILRYQDKCIKKNKVINR